MVRRSSVRSVEYSSGHLSDPGQLSLFPPDRVRVRRPRFAPHPVRVWVSRLAAAVSSVPVLLAAGGVGFVVFVLVEALFPAAADWSAPRVVMGVAAVVVWCSVAGLVTRALDRRGVGRGWSAVSGLNRPGSARG
ncbi:hypothetical protein [Pseudonocardia sp. ICBG1142]|uniref:hypothetical protein n=1 Tax=Pseudonocardia sp. ICBG1142 TaxID=2846760 RepID=UPI001CF6E30F|nr:hypothetical protein [Pseudonocardia sp. ICBG1142]